MKLLSTFLFIASATCYAQGGFSGPGGYIITNVKSGMSLDVPGGGGNLIQTSPNGSPSQIWEFQNTGGGFTIRNAQSGCFLQQVGNRNSDPVVCNRGGGQVWRIQPGKDGNPLIVSQSGKVLDVPDGSNRSGLGIQMYDGNGDSNQRFIFQGAGRGNYNNGNYRNGGNYNNGNNNNNGGVITCSSDDGRRRYCSADTNGGVNLTRQLSGSPCTQGSTWGYDRNGVWVDRGCRAEFQMGGNYNGGGYPGNNGGFRPGGNNQVLTCTSDDGRRHYCQADTSRGVQLTRQISGSACEQGNTWGYDQNGVWVDRGCRAEFQLGRGRR